MKKIALRYALEHPKRTVFIAFLITIIIGSGSQFIFMDDDIMNMLPKDLKSRQVWNKIVEEFKYSDFLFVAFGANGENVFTKENFATSWDLTKSFERMFSPAVPLDPGDNGKTFVEWKDFLDRRRGSPKLVIKGDWESLLQRKCFLTEKDFLVAPLGREPDYRKMFWK